MLLLLLGAKAIPLPSCVASKQALLLFFYAAYNITRGFMVANFPVALAFVAAAAATPAAAGTSAAASGAAAVAPVAASAAAAATVGPAAGWC